MDFLHAKGQLLIRITLGVVFFWFGALKLFAAGEDLILIQNALPVELAVSQVLSITLSFFEILIGVLFLSNRVVRITAIVGSVYLSVITVLVLMTQGFDPRFPVLSLAGEAYLRNLVLIAAMLSIAGAHTEVKDQKSDKPKETVKS